MKRNAHPPATPGAGHRLLLPAVIVLVVIIGAVAGVWWNKSHAPFAKLTGEWQRPDGGYIIAIKRVDPRGKMDAAYFNPKLIHVANAAASLSNETVNVFIELRDVNYPGSTYHLTYDPQNDRLAGIYFQAALNQTYDVFFVRLKQ